MNESSNRSYSNPPVREVPSYQEAIRLQHNIHQQEYEQFHRERVQQFKEIENSPYEKLREVEGDRSSLIKRINTLLVEVDRLSQEKNELATALHEERMVSGEMQRKVKHSGKAKNIVDRNLQSDLKFEKEENSRLRHLLHQIEIERAELRSKLKDYELSASSTAYEKKEMISKIQQKNDQVMILETDNRGLNEKILFLQGKIQEVEGENGSLLRDRGNLCENIARLEIERNEIILKLHEEVARNENFQISKNNEIENMKWIQKRHCRLLASRNVALELEKIVAKAYNFSINRIKESNSFDSAKFKGTQKIIANVFKFYSRTEKRYFDAWRGKLNWKNTQNTRLKLVDLYQEKSAKAKIFSEWRALFLHKLRIKRQNALCVSVLSRLFKDKIESSKRNRFIQFKAYCFHDKSKDFMGSKLTVKAFVGKLRSALMKWQRFNERMREVQCREDLATDFATALLRAKYFFAFKEYTKVKRKEREILAVKEENADKLYQISVLNELGRYTQKKNAKASIVKKIVKRWIRKDQYRAINSWKAHVSTKKKLEKMELYFISNDLTKSNIVKEKLFMAWKNMVIANKLARTKAELEIEKPLREKYEYNFKVTLAEKRRLHQIKAGRIFAKCFRGELFSYFTHWKDHTSYFKEAKPRIKRMILKEYMFKISKAFHLWRKALHEINFSELYRQNTKYAESNSALLDHVSNLEDALSVQVNRNMDLSRQTMKRVIFRIQNFKLSCALRAWAQNAFKSSNMYSAAMMIEKGLRHFIYRKCVVAIMNQSIRRKRRDVTRRKLTNFVMVQLRGCVELTFDAWRQYLAMAKRTKQMIIKIAHRKGLIKKQLYFNRLKKQIKGIREAELRVHSEKVSLERQALQKNFEKLTGDYNEESAKAAKYLKNLKKRSRLRIVNALVRCSQGCRRVFWARWLAAISLKDSKIAKMANLRRLWNKCSQRKSWRSWILYIKRKFEHIASNEIALVRKNTKIIQREAKGFQENLQQEIINRDNIIKTCEKKIQYEETLKEFLLNRGIRQFEEEYSENKASFAFKVLKKRYMRIKKKVLKFSDLFVVLRKKYAFLAIKAEARETNQANYVQNLIIGTCKNFHKRYMRNKFDTWHRNMHFVHENRLMSKIQIDTAKINELNMMQRTIQKNNMAKMFGVLMGKTQNNVFVAWKGISKKLRAIRLAGYKFSQISKLRKFSFSMGKWQDFSRNSKNEMRKAQKAAGNYYSKLLTRMFRAWKWVHESGQYVSVVFGSVNKRYYRDSLYTGFAAVKLFAAQAANNSKWRGRSQENAITRVLYTRAKRLLLRNFRKWVGFMDFKETANSKVRRSILRSLFRKYRSAFDLWTECFKIRKTVENVNREGTVAIENSYLKGRNEILLKLIEDEGIDQRYVERYINEREDLKAALKRKGISRLRYKAGLVNPSDNSLIPRLFTTWKLWVIKRKRIMKFAHRMLAYRKKPDLMRAFLNWKKGFPLVVNTVSKLPRRELYGLVAKMDRDIKTLEGRLENTNNDLVYMNAYSEVLMTHTKRGQNLALAIGKSNIQRTFYRVFLRWTMHTNLCKLHDLLAQLTSVEENFYITRTTLKALEDDNQQIIEENMDLRQASLDGIAIAEAFETLSKEREKLSVDLAERTATIKKLLEHNNELALRLKQFTVDDKFVTPDREMYRTKKY